MADGTILCYSEAEEPFSVHDFDPLYLAPEDRGLERRSYEIFNSIVQTYPSLHVGSFKTRRKGKIWQFREVTWRAGGTLDIIHSLYTTVTVGWYLLEQTQQRSDDLVLKSHPVSCILYIHKTNKGANQFWL